MLLVYSHLLLWIPAFAGMAGGVAGIAFRDAPYMVHPRFGRAGFGVGRRKVAVIYPASRWARVAQAIMEICAFPSLFVRLHAGLDELRRDQLDVVTEPLERPRPMMGAAARLHRHQACRQRRYRLGQFAAVHGFAEHLIAILVHCVNVKTVLREVNAHYCWRVEY